MNWRWLVGRTFNLGHVINVFDSTVEFRSESGVLKMSVYDFLEDHLCNSDQ